MGNGVDVKRHVRLCCRLRPSRFQVISSGEHGKHGNVDAEAGVNSVLRLKYCVEKGAGNGETAIRAPQGVVLPFAVELGGDGS